MDINWRKTCIPMYVVQYYEDDKKETLIGINCCKYYISEDKNSEHMTVY